MPDHSLVRRLLSEPLAHFLVIGAFLFLVFGWQSGGRSSANRIVITPGQVDSIVAGFARTWQRPPTEEELKAQIDEYVRDEIATREALAMGLDRDDSIVRRRLRQKFEFLAEEAVTLAPPTDEQLQAWLDAHAEDYQRETSVAFRQVMLSRELRGGALDEDVRALLTLLDESGPDAVIESLSDSVLLPPDIPLSTQGEVARLFGDAFADAIVSAETGRWTGPIPSGYGVHVVLVKERQEGGRSALADVRDQVERDFVLDQRTRQLDEVYEKLLERYTVVIEERVVSDDASGAAEGESR